MTESGAQRLQRGAPAGGEGRRRALWRRRRRRRQRQQEPPSPRPPLPRPPAARSAGCTGGTGLAAATRPPGAPERLRRWRSGARGSRRACCPFKTPGRWRPVRPPRPGAARCRAGAAPAPPLLGCGITGRDAAGSLTGRGSVRGRDGVVGRCARRRLPGSPPRQQRLGCCQRARCRRGRPASAPAAPGGSCRAVLGSQASLGAADVG